MDLQETKGYEGWHRLSCRFLWSSNTMKWPVITRQVHLTKYRCCTTFIKMYSHFNINLCNIKYWMKVCKAKWHKYKLYCIAIKLICFWNKWRSSSLSDSTSIIFNMELTHLGLEVCIYTCTIWISDDHGSTLFLYLNNSTLIWYKLLTFLIKQYFALKKTSTLKIKFKVIY